MKMYPDKKVKHTREESQEHDSALHVDWSQSQAPLSV